MRRVWCQILMTALLSTPAISPRASAEPTGGEDGAAPSEEKARQPEKVFESLTVTGGADSVEEIPGSASYLAPERLEEQSYSDIHRILRLMPGINVQEEDGYGLRPNIGMRGTGVERSQKITLLEDGVLIAPAPYSSPSAYYVPVAGRIRAVEARKGSSSIIQGPYTNGGVINLVSTAIPLDLGGSVELGAGEHETLRLHAVAGGSGKRFGWLLETYQLDTEGFKHLDGGGSTGVDLEDYLGKLRYQSREDAQVFQAIELKLGANEQFGDETYLGLTRADFDRAPYRRYAGSQRDFITSDHEQYQLRYVARPSAETLVTATLYRNDFFRNWHKLQSVEGVGLAGVVDAPRLHPRELAILRGETDATGGPLAIRNNRRDYRSQGLDLVVDLDLRIGGADHGLQAGLRLHEDEEDRFQEEELWNMVGGQMELLQVLPPGSQSNRIDSAEATAIFLRDEIRFGRWSLSPGLRFEQIDFERLDYGRSDPLRVGDDVTGRSSDAGEVLPGLGASYQLDGSWSLFGGLHKGFASPGPGQDEEVEPEESLNWEAGFNYRRRRLGARVVVFYSDYDNLLGRDTLSSGGEGTGDAFNGGAVEVSGVEASLDYDLGQAAGWGVSVPVRLAYTFTSAEFRSSFETDFADWAPEVTAGDELPYIPEQQLHLSLGWQRGNWSTFLDLSYSDEMRSEPGQGPIPSGTEIDDFVLADVSASYRVRSGLELFARIRNVSDETYLVARRPAGARPGMPRAALVGVTWNFGGW